MTKLTAKQTEQVYAGYPVNVKGGFVYVNEHGDIEFIASDSLVDETIRFEEEY